jgi:hypothetical protein
LTLCAAAICATRSTIQSVGTAGHNNPYFEPLLNSNDDHRTRWLGGVGGSYADPFGHRERACGTIRTTQRGASKSHQAG